MAKEFLRVLKICDYISKYAIYVLVVLMPIFFLPVTSEVLDFNKQAILVILVFLSLFALMIKILISGKFFANSNKTHIAIVVLFIVSALSTIFSQDKYGSFWGWPRITTESLLTMVSLCLFYFIVSNIFSKKEIFISIIIFLLSSLVAVLYGVFQLFGLFIIPISFTKIGSFNTIGSVGNLGMILAILLPLLTVFMATVVEKWLKIILGIGIVVSIILFLLINYVLVWWIVLIGCALTITFGMFKRNLFDLRWLAIPIFFFVLALFFIIVSPQISAPQRPVEVYFNQSSSLDVALKTMKEKPIFGSGPGTFIFDFSKYKKQEFNQNQLWNLKFDSGASKALTLLATTGILGFASFLVLMAVVIFYGVMFITKEIDGSKSRYSDKSDLALKIVASGIFIAFLVQSISYFIFNPSLSVDFLYFLLIAGFVGLISPKKDYNLTPSSFLTLGVTLVFTLIFIFGLGIIILEGQRYIAEVNFNKGIIAYAKGQGEEGLKSFEKAVGQNPNIDIYLTNLSQAYLSEIAKLVSKNELSDVEKEKLQILINNTINAAKIATDINPQNVSNWSVRGSIYQNLIGIVPGSEDWAITSYQEASNLDPVNPYYVIQKGIVLLSKAYGVDKDSEAAKKSDLVLAKEQFDKAIKLKSDYASARFQLAMVLQAQGKADQVMPALQETKKYAPNDVGLSFQIGLLYYQDKDYQNAAKELERTISLDEKYSNALYFLGLTYYAQDQDAKAINMIERALKLNPNNEELKKVLDNLNSGNNPLLGIIEEIPAKPPIDEKPLETK